MRSRIIVLALIAVFVAVFSAAPFAQTNPRGKASGKAPVLVMASKTANLGDVLEGQDYTYSFVLKNIGTDELQILSVRPG